jgi:hypothetical protein
MCIQTVSAGLCLSTGSFFTLCWVFKADGKERSMTNCDAALNLTNDLTTLLQDTDFAPAQSRSMTPAVVLQQWRIKIICHRTRTYVTVSLSPRLEITL